MTVIVTVALTSDGANTRLHCIHLSRMPRLGSPDNASGEKGDVCLPKDVVCIL
jgi:hypothetical protein